MTDSGDRGYVKATVLFAIPACATPRQVSPGKGSLVVMKRLAVVSLACMLVLAGCRSGSGCQEFDAYDGTIELTVVDAATGALVPNTTMTLYVSPIDTAVLSIGSDVSQYPAQVIGIGTGTYQLTVAAPGYTTWQAKGGVTVSCAIPPVTVTARLAKSP